MRITATWNPARLEETKITLSGFEHMPDIAQLDFIKDVVWELTDLYHTKLNDFNVIVEDRIRVIKDRK